MSREGERFGSAVRAGARRLFARAKEVLLVDPDKRGAGDVGERAAAGELARSAAELVGHRARDLLRAMERARRHRLRLPALAVVAVYLEVPDRRAERRAVTVAHREQGDLVVEVDEAFDNDLAGAGAAASLRIFPGLADVGRGFHHALALARRRHHGLDHAGHAELLHRVAVLVLARGK